jgi:protein ImuB
MLWVALEFPPLPSGTLEHLAAWACQFTPKVSLEPPHSLVLEVASSLRLFDGLERLSERLHDGLTAMGFSARVAAAQTARAALWRARSATQCIEEVSVEAAFSAEACVFLKGLGIVTIAQVLKLPRDGLARRCGRQIVEDLDRALGTLPEPREFFVPPQRFAASVELPAEVVDAPALLFAARRLLIQLEGLLAARQAGVRGFRLILLHRHEKATVLDVGLASASRDAERFGQLLRERLAALCLARPVEALRLEADDLAPLDARTAGMFGDASADEESWARLLERLRARLGREAVHGLATHPDHRPEYAWRRVEPGEWDPKLAPAPGPRPLWMLERPRHIEEAQFVLLAGPERIESGWWDGDEAQRDYFIVRFPDATLGWIYREQEGWFVHGLFA